MKDYVLITTAHQYPYIIASTTYINPLPYIFEIKETLLDNDFKGDILVDLLLSNGFTYNRFLTVTFDGNDFDFFNAKIKSAPPLNVMTDLYHFYMEHPYLVENSNILPQAQKTILLEGLLIK